MAVHWQQHLLGAALADSHGDGGGDLPHQGVCHQNTDGPGDDVRIPAGYQHRVFPGSPPIRPCFHHGGGGNGVGSHHQRFKGQSGGLDPLGQKRAHAAVLSVNNDQLHTSSFSRSVQRATVAVS